MLTEQADDHSACPDALGVRRAPAVLQYLREPDRPAGAGHFHAFAEAQDDQLFWLDQSSDVPRGRGHWGIRGRSCWDEDFSGE
ncbi:MAG: hypothetical protein EPO65_01675 [Dehalococcoidia bacterium]|nr:MAG: hypothetical protein EPO65_01675 [Dehalococcoidia bacterium]